MFSLFCLEGLASTKSVNYNLTVGQTQLLHFNSVKRIVVGEGAILQVKVLKNKKDVLVIGRSDGFTDLLVWDKDNEKHDFVFKVKNRIDGLDLNEIERLVSDIPNVSIMELSGKYYIRVKNVSESQKNRLKQIAGQSPNIILSIDSQEVFEEKPTVMFRVQFLEIRRNALKNIGISWPGSTSGPGFVFQKGAPDTTNVTSSLASVINFLRENGDARLLAEPVLSCLSGEKADFLAGGEAPIPVRDESGLSVEFKNYGVELVVEPVVNSKKRIKSKIKVKVSSVDNSVTVLGVPGFLSRHASTTFDAESGDNLILAGLFNQEYSKSTGGIEGLSRLPIIGELFKSRQFRKNETELVVIVTPTLKGDNGKYENEINYLDELIESSGETFKFNFLD